MARVTISGSQITSVSNIYLATNLGGRLLFPVINVSASFDVGDTISFVGTVRFPTGLEFSIFSGWYKAYGETHNPTQKTLTFTSNGASANIGNADTNITFERYSNTNIRLLSGETVLNNVNANYADAVTTNTTNRQYRGFCTLTIIKSDVTGAVCFVVQTSDLSVADNNVYFETTIESGSPGYCVFYADRDVFIAFSDCAVYQIYKDVYDTGGDTPTDTDPYGQIDGETDLTGDTVGIPSDPALSVTSTGIVGLFSPTSQQMQDLADFMWTDFGGTGTTVEDILSEIVQALKRSISNPLDYVIGLNIIPSQGLSKGSSKVIRFGFVSSGVSMPELTSQFFTVDCGTLSFDYLCGNTFLDYAPYSKFSIYLPYIGVKEVDANDFVGHTIGVKYKGDVVTGGLTAFITKDGSVMYQFSGSCALNIPLTADNWGSTISAAINVATAVIGAASMPGAGLAAAAGAAGKAAVGATVSNVAANPSLLSPQVARSGAISGGAGAIGVQYPYVIREAVRFHSTSQFNTLTGYPSYYFRSLADVTGYTVVYDCHLENIPATDVEIREIEQLLAGGVIL